MEEYKMFGAGQIRYNVNTKTGVTFSMKQIEEYLWEYLDTLPKFEHPYYKNRPYIESHIESIVNDEWDVQYALYISIDRFVFSFRVKDMMTSALPNDVSNRWYPDHKYSWMQILIWSYDPAPVDPGGAIPTMEDDAKDILAIIRPMRDFLQRRLNGR